MTALTQKCTSICIIVIVLYVIEGIFIVLQVLSQISKDLLCYFYQSFNLHNYNVNLLNH